MHSRPRYRRMKKPAADQKAFSVRTACGVVRVNAYTAAPVTPQAKGPRTLFIVGWLLMVAKLRLLMRNGIAAQPNVRNDVAAANPGFCGSSK